MSTTVSMENLSTENISESPNFDSATWQEGLKITLKDLCDKHIVPNHTTSSIDAHGWTIHFAMILRDCEFSTAISWTNSLCCKELNSFPKTHMNTLEALGIEIIDLFRQILNDSDTAENMFDTWALLTLPESIRLAHILFAWAWLHGNQSHHTYLKKYRRDVLEGLQLGISRGINRIAYGNLLVANATPVEPLHLKTITILPEELIVLKSQSDLPYFGEFDITLLEDLKLHLEDSSLRRTARIHVIIPMETDATNELLDASKRYVDTILAAKYLKTKDIIQTRVHILRELLTLNPTTNWVFNGLCRPSARGMTGLFACSQQDPEAATLWRLSMEFFRPIHPRQRSRHRALQTSWPKIYKRSIP